MDKINFDDFLKGIDPFTESFVVPMHEWLTEKSYTVEVKPAAQGPVVSYKTPKKKKTAFNYVFRKSGMQVRIYGDNVREYLPFLTSLPADMQEHIVKATDCRLCNARCPKGYSVSIMGENYNKCRYGAFLFPLNPQTMTHIKMFIENEVSEREKNI